MSALSKAATVSVLMEVGRRAALDSTHDHPEDLGYAMSLAIETAAATLKVLRERKLA